MALSGHFLPYGVPGLILASSMAPHDVVVRVVSEAVGTLVELTEHVAAWFSLVQAFSQVVPITGAVQLKRWFRWIPMASLRWCQGSPRLSFWPKSSLVLWRWGHRFCRPLVQSGARSAPCLLW